MKPPITMAGKQTGVNKANPVAVADCKDANNDPATTFPIPA